MFTGSATDTEEVTCFQWISKTDERVTGHHDPAAIWAHLRPVLTILKNRGYTEAIVEQSIDSTSPVLVVPPDVMIVDVVAPQRPVSPLPPPPPEPFWGRPLKRTASCYPVFGRFVGRNTSSVLQHHCHELNRCFWTFAESGYSVRPPLHLGPARCTVTENGPTRRTCILGRF